MKKIKIHGSRTIMPKTNAGFAKLGKTAAERQYYGTKEGRERVRDAIEGNRHRKTEQGFTKIANQFAPNNGKVQQQIIKVLKNRNTKRKQAYRGDKDVDGTDLGDGRTWNSNKKLFKKDTGAQEDLIKTIIGKRKLNRTRKGIDKYNDEDEFNDPIDGNELEELIRLTLNDNQFYNDMMMEFRAANNKDLNANTRAQMRDKIAYEWERRKVERGDDIAQYL